MAGPRAGQAVITIGADATGFQQSLAKQTQTAARKAGGRFNTAIGKTLKRGAIATGAVVAGTLGTALVQGFKRLSAIDQATAKLGGLGHSAKNVKGIMNDALASVKGTAFGLGEAATVAAGAVASGVKPGKDLRRTLTLVGDAATIGGVSMAEMGAIFNKVSASGKVQGDVLNQLGDKGIPILQLLGKEIGKTPAEVQKLASAGKIDFATFQNAMEKGLGGAALKSGETFTGALANVKAALGRFGAALLGGVFSQLPGVFGEVIGWIDAITPAAVKMGESAGRAFGRIWTAAKGLIDLVVKGDFTGNLRKAFGVEEDSPIIDRFLTIRDTVIRVFDAIKARVAALSGGAWGPIIAGAAGFGAVIAGLAAKFNVLIPFLSGLFPLLSKLGGVLRFVGGPFTILIGLFAAAYATSKPFRDAINGLMVTLGGLIGTLAAGLAPILAKVAATLLPAFISVIDALVPAFVPIIAAVSTLAEVALPVLIWGLDKVIAAVLMFTPVVKAIAPAVLLGVVAFKALGVGMVVFRGIMTATRAVMAVFRGAMIAVNLVMSMNPIGLVVIALVALGAALAVAWNKSETFRNIVIGTWEAIKTAAGAVLSWFTDTLWPLLQGGIDKTKAGFQAFGDIARQVFGWVADKASWLWDKISPIVTAIYNAYATVLVTAFNVWWGIVTRVFTAVQILALALWAGLKWVFDQIKGGLGWVGDKFKWLYNNVVKPVFSWITSYLASNWEAIKKIFNWLKQGLGWVGDKFKWLWEKAVKPVLGWIVSFLSDSWAAIQKIFGWLKDGLGWVGDKFKWLWNSGVKPVFGWIGDKISAVWNNTIAKVFSAMRTGVDRVKGAFETAKNGIRTAWNALEGIAKKPIRFVIGTVLNKGLIRGFNWLSDKIGGPKIKDIPIPFKRGGVLPGYTPGRDVHRFYSPTGGSLDLSGGEGIMRPEFTRAVGGVRGINALNAAARRGALPFKDGGVFGHQAFAGGGVLGWIKSKAVSSFDWMRDKAGAVWNAIKDPLAYIKSKLPKMDTAKTIAEYGGAAVKNLTGVAVTNVKKLFDSFKSAFGKSEAERDALTGSIVGGKVGIVKRIGKFISPVNRRPSFPWGRYPSGGLHRAYDIAAPTGTPIRAPLAGRVIRAGWDGTGFGNHVRTRDSDGNYSIFGHLSRIATSVGAALRAGQVFGYVGSTGRSSGPHLHWERRTSPMNPASAYNFGAFRKGGVLDPFLADEGVRLARGLNLLDNRTGGPEPLGRLDRAGTTINIETITISLDDIARMNEVMDFIEMIKGARVQTRRTARSGMVNA